MRRARQASYYSSPRPGTYSGASYYEPSQESTSRAESFNRNQTQKFMSTAGTNIIVPLYQESINVGKRQVEAGAVRLRKVVKTETVNQPVELRREEVVIERLPAGAQGAQAQSFGQPFEQQETVIPVTREEAVVEKQTTPAGQIVVRSSFRTEQTNIQAQVRREDVDINKVGNPQNVIIGQNVQSSARPNEGAGAAESAGGQGTGAGSDSGKITQADMLSSSNPSSLMGRQVQLSQCKVENVLPGNLIALSCDGTQTFYAIPTQQGQSLNVGDMVTISGRVRPSSGSELSANLGEQSAQKLRSQAFFIEADKIQIMEK